MKSESKCPFCGAALISEDHCHSCHAFKIKGYVSREARSRINFISAGVSLVIVFLISLIAFIESVGIVVYITIIICFIIILLTLNKIMLKREVKKGKVVWKRAMITW